MQHIADFEIVDMDMWDRPLVDIVRFNPAAGTHALVHVPADLAEAWNLKPGFACPVDHVTREPFWGPLRYLLSLHDRGKWNAQTNRTYAFGMKPALEALVLEGRPYDYLDDDVVTTVVNSLVQGKGRLGEPISGSTIECYVRTLARCAEHTNELGLTSISIDADAHVARGWRVANMLDADGRRIDTSALIGARRHMIRPLHKATTARIEGALLMDPRRWHRKGPSSRPGVTFANGRRLGLRLIENLGIMKEEVMRYTVTDPNQEYIFPVLRTKGADYRNVFVFGRDIIRWQGYASHERAACVARARDIHGRNWDEPPELLVNGFASGVHVGAATQPSSIQRDFRDVQERLGMVDTVEVPGPNGTVREVRV